MKRSHKRSQYLADLRFAVCCAVLALLFLPVQRNYAQDVLPGCPRLQKTAFDCLESTDSVRIRCPFLSSPCPQPFGNWAGTS